MIRAGSGFASSGGLTYDLFMSRPLRIHQQMLSMGLDLVQVVADERWELALEVSGISLCVQRWPGATRLSSDGVGLRENLIGLGTDDLRDALDRRVEFRVVECS